MNKHRTQRDSEAQKTPQGYQKGKGSGGWVN